MNSKPLSHSESIEESQTDSDFEEGEDNHLEQHEDSLDENWDPCSFDGDEEMTPQNKRTPQHVATLGDVRNCVQWMEQEFSVHGRARLMTKTVKQFPSLFKTNAKANLQRASRYWKDKDNILRNTCPKVKALFLKKTLLFLFCSESLLNAMKILQNSVYFR